MISPTLPRKNPSIAQKKALEVAQKNAEGLAYNAPKNSLILLAGYHGEPKVNLCHNILGLYRGYTYSRNFEAGLWWKSCSGTQLQVMDSSGDDPEPRPPVPAALLLPRRPPAKSLRIWGLELLSLT